MKACWKSYQQCRRKEFSSFDQRKPFGPEHFLIPFFNFHRCHPARWVWNFSTANWNQRYFCHQLECEPGASNHRQNTFDCVGRSDFIWPTIDISHVNQTTNLLVGESFSKHKPIYCLQSFLHYGCPPFCPTPTQLLLVLKKSTKLIKENVFVFLKYFVTILIFPMAIRDDSSFSMVHRGQMPPPCGRLLLPLPKQTHKARKNK